MLYYTTSIYRRRPRCPSATRRCPWTRESPTSSRASAWRTRLYYTVLYYDTLLQCTIRYDTILYYTILYYTILYYTILYYTILLCCTVLYCTILYYIILHYTILYYTILYYTVRRTRSPSWPTGARRCHSSASRSTTGGPRPLRKGCFFYGKGFPSTVRDFLL